MIGFRFRRVLSLVVSLALAGGLFVGFAPYEAGVYQPPDEEQVVIGFSEPPPDYAPGETQLEEQPALFTVTFDSNRGEFYEGEPTHTQVAEGQGVDVFPVVVKPGYLPDGWNTQPDGSGDTFDRDSVVGGDITVYAQWESVLAPVLALPANVGSIQVGSFAELQAAVAGAPVGVEIRVEITADFEFGNQLGISPGQIITLYANSNRRLIAPNNARHFITLFPLGGVGSTLNLQNGIALVGNGGNGGGVNVTYGSKLHMSGNAAITDNRASTVGGGVLISVNGTLNMSDSASIADNQAAGNGGGVFMSNHATLNMTDNASIANNQAENSGGGGVFVSGNNSTIDIEGEASVSNNVANGNGGGIFIGGTSTLNMDSGRIYSNSARNGGGIYAVAMSPSHSPIFIGADVVFYGNSANEGFPYRNPAYDAIYQQNIHGTRWTYPFTQGFNNYDIAHQGELEPPSPVLITLDPNGGTFGGSFGDNFLHQHPFPPGTSLGDLGDYVFIPTPSSGQRARFLGWNTHPDGIGDVFDITTIVYESMTVFAMWEPLVDIHVHVNADHGMAGAQVVLRSNQGRFVPPHLMSIHPPQGQGFHAPIYDEIVISAPGETPTMVSTGVDFHYFNPGWLDYPIRQIGILPGTNVWIEITDLDPALAPFFEVSVHRYWNWNHDYITPGEGSITPIESWASISFSITISPTVWGAFLTDIPSSIHFGRHNLSGSIAGQRISLGTGEDSTRPEEATFGVFNSIGGGFDILVTSRAGSGSSALWNRMFVGGTNIADGSAVVYSERGGEVLTNLNWTDLLHGGVQVDMSGWMVNPGEHHAYLIWMVIPEGGSPQF